MKRCQWAEMMPELNGPYHDKEWGVPVYDDRLLFEFLILEGFQAGLSWTTILKKRDHFREVFDGFDPVLISQYDDRKKQTLLSDSGIIRNRLKINASIKNAQAFLAVQKEFGSFSNYIWQFVGNKPGVNRWKKMADIPANTSESDKMSKDLKRRGFSFVGSTICYAFMQAVGMVNDHLVSCFRYNEINSLFSKMTLSK